MKNNEPMTKAEMKLAIRDIATSLCGGLGEEEYVVLCTTLFPRNEIDPFYQSWVQIYDEDTVCSKTRNLRYFIGEGSNELESIEDLYSQMLCKYDREKNDFNRDRERLVHPYE